MRKQIEEEFISTGDEEDEAGQGLLRLVQLGIFLLGLLISLAIAFPNFVPTWDPLRLPLNIDLGLADSTVNLRALWWTDSQNSNVTQLRNQVLIAINEKLTHHGIDLPFPTQVVLFHDQTEETDGDRRRQREGFRLVKGMCPSRSELWTLCNSGVCSPSF